jgi:hypothetical protein
MLFGHSWLHRHNVPPGHYVALLRHVLLHGGAPNVTQEPKQPQTRCALHDNQNKWLASITSFIYSRNLFLRVGTG